MLVQEEICFQPNWPSWPCLGEWKVVPVRRIGPAGREPVLDPQAAGRYWKEVVEASPDYTPEVERLVAVATNSRGIPLGHAVCSVGTADSTTFHPREIFRAAIVASAVAILVIHNHPSGDPSPSASDRRVTLALREASTLLQITFHDHVIIGDPDIFSFRESGML